jgi:hypothetical protein
VTRYLADNQYLAPDNYLDFDWTTVSGGGTGPGVIELDDVLDFLIPQENTDLVITADVNDLVIPPDVTDIDFGTDDNDLGF